MRRRIPAQEYKHVARELEGNWTEFTPHYIVWVCPEAYRDSDECKSQCIHQGRYCTPDPDGDLTAGYSGADIVQARSPERLARGRAHRRLRRKALGLRGGGLPGRVWGLPLMPSVQKRWGAFRASRIVCNAVCRGGHHAQPACLHAVQRAVQRTACRARRRGCELRRTRWQRYREAHAREGACRADDVAGASARARAGGVAKLRWAKSAARAC